MTMQWKDVVQSSQKTSWITRELRESEKMRPPAQWRSLFVLCGIALFAFKVVQAGQTCYRSYTRGVLYRGSVSRARESQYNQSEVYMACQKWTDQSPNGHNFSEAHYPNTGLGNHNYCRNPDVNGTRTRPWCFYKDRKGWGTCWEVPHCSDSSCYSTIGKGGSYSGSVNRAANNKKCIRWSDADKSKFDFSVWPGLKTAVGWLGTEKTCRNPGFIDEKPWCFYNDKMNVERGVCNVPECDDVEVVSPTCGGTGEDSACVFPFTYKGFIFINCTTYSRSWSWCATERDSNRVMTKWGYCQCPLPTTQIPTTAMKTTKPATSQSNLTTKAATTQPKATSSATNRPTTSKLTTYKPSTSRPAMTQSSQPVTGSGTTQAQKTSSGTTLSTTARPLMTQQATSRSSSTTTQTTTNQPTTKKGSTSPPIVTTATASKSPITLPLTKKQTTAKPTTTVSTVVPTTTKKILSTRANTLPGTEKPASTAQSVPALTASPPASTSSDQLMETARPTNENSASPLEQSQVLPLYIGAAVGGVVVVCGIVILLVTARRGKRNDKKTDYNDTKTDYNDTKTDYNDTEEDALYLGSIECTTSGPANRFQSNPVYEESKNVSTSNMDENLYASMGPQEEIEEEIEEEPYEVAVDLCRQAALLSTRESQYIRDRGLGDLQAIPPLPARHPTKMVLPGQMQDNFYEPADTEEGLYEQFVDQRTRRLHREDLVIDKHLGSGEFGNVEMAVWKTGAIEKDVAVKTLISKDEKGRVAFLKEAAIMSQFLHQNIVELIGLVTEGEPLMIVVELMAKGDLKKHLAAMQTAYRFNLPKGTDKTFLEWTRDIASGMKYLSEKGFVHRDLAARNVLVNENLIAKIGDFGMSRDLDESNYYHVQSPTKIPIRWTPPEVIEYKKYTSSSDVWSFGIVMYEIWSVGKRPYDYFQNSNILDKLEEGYRLPPPPGCPRAIYAMMIDCWHSDHHVRPKFSRLSSQLTNQKKMLVNSTREEQIVGKLGGDLEDSQDLYRDLQMTYNVTVT